MSPFKNSRTLLRSPSLRSRSSRSGKSSHWWFPTVSMATLKDSCPFSVVNLYETLHGFIVFEVAWEDVRGINYSNVLQVKIQDDCIHSILYAEQKYEKKIK